MNTGALRDIRVLDLSRVLAGPYCAMLLGDMGAEVIKIEQPGSGDITRSWGPPWAGEQSAYYLCANRNKYSVTVNLKHPDGQKIIRQLAAASDILIENFLPGVMDELGLGYEQLSEENPGLIYCSITGYGQTGPYKDRPGFDFVIQGEAGMMSISGEAGGEPLKTGVAIADMAAALYASTAILGALHHRNQTGKGQYVDVALFDAQLALLVNQAHNYFATGVSPRRLGNAHPNIVPYESYPTADGHLVLGIGTDAQYRRFCHAAGRPDLWNETYATNAGRVAHREALGNELRALFAQRTTQDWLNLLEAHKIPAGPVNTLAEAFHNPHTQAREMMVAVDHPQMGAVLQLGPAARLGGTPASIRLPPPRLGEHTAWMLERLGYAPEDLHTMRQRGVI